MEMTPMERVVCPELRRLACWVAMGQPLSAAPFNLGPEQYCVELTCRGPEEVKRAPFNPLRVISETRAVCGRQRA